MYRVLGVVGRLLLRLPLLMLVSSRVVLFVIGVWSCVGVLLWLAPSGWVVLKFVRLAGTLRIRKRGEEVMCSLLLSYWT